MSLSTMLGSIRILLRCRIFRSLLHNVFDISG